MRRLPNALATLLAFAVCATAFAADRTVTVATDTLRAEISLADGSLSRLELLREGSDGAPVVLLGPGRGRLSFRLHGASRTAPPRYVSAADHYELAPGQDQVEIRLVADDGQMRDVRSYTFWRGRHTVELAGEVANLSSNGTAETVVFELEQVREDGPAMAGGYDGPAVFTGGEGFRKLPFQDIAKGRDTDPTAARDGWIAMLRPYFATALIPAGTGDRQYAVRQIDGERFGASVRMPEVVLAPGESRRLGMVLYAGPRSQDALAGVAPGFEQILDYGWLSVLAEPLFGLLRALKSMVGNWGWAIVLLTLIVKALLYPLSARSYAAMARLRAMAPRVDALRRTHAGDKTRLGEAILDLYDEAGANPASGIVPLLVQVPIFLALFAVLRGAVELRGAPWMFWIADLSVPDPRFVLPLVMLAAMAAQAALAPRAVSLHQRALAWALPVALAAAFSLMPAGLVLYWTVNTVLSALQQWQLTRSVARVASPAAAPQTASAP